MNMIKIEWVGYCYVSVILLIVGCKNQTSNINVDKNRENPSELTTEIENDPLNPELRYERAQDLYNTGQYDLAIEDLRVAILEDSLNNKYYNLLGNAFLDGNNSSKAMLTMQKAAELFPDSINTILQLSEFQLILKQYDKSISSANGILRLHPQNANAFFMIGMGLRAKGEEDRAIQAFQTATEFDASLTDAWIILGNMFEAKGEPIAERYYNAAVNVAPENISALHSKAFYIQNQGDILGAIALYDKISIVDQSYEAAYLNKGVLLLELDSLQSAKHVFSNLLEINNDNQFGLLYLAVCENLEGNNANALEIVNKLLAINPDMEEAKRLKQDLSNQ